MKKNWKNNITRWLVLVLPLILFSCADGHQSEGIATGVTHTCPMHPQIVKNAPGTCPVCGMDLVPQQPQNAPPVPLVSDLNYLLRPTNQLVQSQIKTVTPQAKAVRAERSFPGIITYDTRRQYTIPARVGGRIEKLYVQFNYQPVSKGQKLYEIYSPELVTAQQELIYLLQHDSQNQELIRASEQKLLYLGVTKAQINQIRQRRQVSYTHPVYSPYTGYVVDPSVAPAPGLANPGATTQNNVAGATMNAMGGNAANNPNLSSPPANPPSGNLPVREGMYVNPGQTLFKVINAEQVWATFRIRPAEAAFLNKGTPLTVRFNQNTTDSVNTRVDLVQPFYEAGESFAQIRALLPGKNKNALVGQLVTGQVNYSTGQALWIPRAATLDLGTITVAFRQVAGGFQPQAITVGEKAGDLVLVQSGLTAQTLIAANAQFLIDSESFIRVGTPE